MTYQPKPRPRMRDLPMFRPDFMCRCDVCGKARNRGDHKACSVARKAAGFTGGADE